MTTEELQEQGAIYFDKITDGVSGITKMSNW